MAEGAEAPKGPAAPPQGGPATAAGKRKILAVDDSETVLLVERSLLSRSYVVVTAKNGEEGVAKAIAERPDLILMDVMMPRLNGFDAVRRLRSEPATRNIPIIMVTTRSEAQNVQTGYENGCTDYVTKPFDGPALLAKVKSRLPPPRDA